MKNLARFSFFACLSMFIACSVPASLTVSSEKTQEVLDHHLTAIGQNDLDAIVSDYTEESVITTPDGSYKGLDQIRGFFTEILKSFPSEGTTLEMKKMTVDNELAYITWNATTPTLKVPFGTDTFIIKGGKIQRQTFAGVLNPIDTGSFHITVGAIPPNPKSGFTNVYGKGGLSIGYLDIPAPMDFSPLFEGLPGDLCSSPHWGYVIEGDIRIIYGDGKEELVKAGEAFYWPAPHTAVVDKRVKLVDFSPDQDFIPLMDHIAAKMKAAQSGK